jgi:hypothetical protein
MEEVKKNSVLEEACSSETSRCHIPEESNLKWPNCRLKGGGKKKRSGIVEEGWKGEDLEAYWTTFSLNEGTGKASKTMMKWRRKRRSELEA